MIERHYRRASMAVRSLLRRRAAERELDEELRFHLDQMQQLADAGGDDLPRAARQARSHAGSIEAVKEACRDMRPLRPLEHLLQDLRFGARLLIRGRGFTVVAVLSLALGIGTSSAIVSLINAIVLRPLPVANPQELYIAQVAQVAGAELQFPYPFVEQAAAHLAGRAVIAAHSTKEAALVAIRTDGAEAGPAESADLQLVAGDYFGALRQRPQIGRLLGPGDNRVLGQHPVVVISDAYWRRRFGRTTRVLDTEVVVNGTVMAIVGVAAPGFFGTTVATETPDLWAPAQMQAVLRFAGNYDLERGDLREPWPPQSGLGWLQVMVRVPGGDAPAIAGALTATRRGVVGPDGSPAPVSLRPGAGGYSSLRDRLSTPLVVLLLAVGLLLAIACGNIAGLLLARATSRRREMAIRLSMGAERGRLIRQLLTESLLLSAIGGLLGLALAQVGSPALLALLTSTGPATGIDVTPDWRVIGLTGVTSMATAVAFGLLPALRGTHVPLADSLKAQSRSVIGGDRRSRHLPIGKLLVAGQMALAVLLLLVAALFMRSLQALANVDTGFDRQQVLMARIDPRSSGYAATELPALYARLTDVLARLPGVTAVSLSSTGAFSGRNSGNFLVEGYTLGRDERLATRKNWVTFDFFRTVGLSVTRGRAFREDDAASHRPVCVISETIARRYFHGRDPIGRRITWGSTNFEADGYEIVGVVEDARYNDVRSAAGNMTYLLATQADRYANHVQLRVGGDPAAAIPAMRNALRQSEPRLAVGAIETLDAGIARSMGVERLLGWLTSIFGAAALSLACLGLYGTVAYAVRRRTAELGVRLALGARRGAVQWLLVREALRLVLLGAAIGLPLAVIAAHAVGSLLYATTPVDPLAYVSAAGVLVAVAAVAAYLPARRASRLDPMTALRSE